MRFYRFNRRKSMNVFLVILMFFGCFFAVLVLCHPLRHVLVLFGMGVFYVAKSISLDLSEILACLCSCEAGLHGGVGSNSPTAPFVVGGSSTTLSLSPT